MIARLIAACIRNRALVLLLAAGLIGAGLFAMRNLTIDAIPDLSDVQVVIRTEYAGQAPQIVEDQITYPLTTAMLAVPYARTVRGYSMFGTSFIYVIFEDGTDLYWARSRVLEQLSTVRDRLPAGAAPQLGPDATGVGWVYQYVLVTGRYCAEHPQGLWHDPLTDTWHASVDDVPEEAQRRLVHHRIFGDTRTVYADMQGRQYERLADAPAAVRDDLSPVEVAGGLVNCPLTGQPLVEADLDLADLRSLQDWYLRYELTAVDGVSEVAPIGGFVKQYQIVVDPAALLAYRIPLERVRSAVKRSNVDVGGRVVEISETEYMVRGIGYLGAGEVDGSRTDAVLEDLRQVALGASPEGAPIYVKDVAQVQVGPEIRRGVAEWNGQGEVVGGIVVMRFGENAQRTIERVRDRLVDLERGLPAGVALDVAYDRSDLIERAIHTVSDTLIEEILVVSLVMLVFLLHARSALVAAVVLPMGVLATLLVMYLLDINANIMSLGGIAISIGVMVDSSIVMVENAHKRLEQWQDAHAGQTITPTERVHVVAEAAKEVGPTLFFSLLVITVSFLPIFVLQDQMGRMFRPLAYTKTFAMAAGALLAVTIIPVLMTYFISERVLPGSWSRVRQWMVALLLIAGPAALLAVAPLGEYEPWRWWFTWGWALLAALTLIPQRIYREQANPISGGLQRLYDPFFVLSMRLRWLVLPAAVLVLLVSLYPLSRLGSEFMPPLEEGDLLYMPTTDPGLSITKAREVLQQTDKLIMTFPEVQSVFGKVGRAETATDPAPLSMLESTIMLHRDKTRWRHVPVPRFFDDWPAWLRDVPERIWPTSRPITVDELVYGYHWPDGTAVPGLNEVVQIPGLTNSWTMPIKTRIDMLSTGIRTPVGIKVMGDDLQRLAELADNIAQVVKTDEGTASFTVSAFAEKSVGGNYIDIRIDREQIARYGLTVGDVQDVIMTALGGMNVDTTVEGLERYPINIRYPRELRDNLPALRATLVPTPSGAQVPLQQLADLEVHKGPPMVKSENARRTAWVYVDIAGVDVGTYVASAQRAVDAAVDLPPGYTIVWSGQYEYMAKARQQLITASALTAVAIVLLLYAATRSFVRVLIVFLAVPFSLVGAIWLVWALDYNLSLAVAVGMIALVGLDAETGLIMLLYQDNSYDSAVASGRMRHRDDLWDAVYEGAVQRIRPKTMTVVTTFVGLLPLLWAEGAGADTMRRLAAPMIGGLASSFLLELLVYPVVYYFLKAWKLPAADADGQPAPVTS